ncbi:putative NTPase, NACHT family domain [Nostoc flagelliforme CCNUN1]|uniref:Putative NTPase, NACHT family domain n=1 Tax=Nostoc flagelliforme CCNUN1 TaxID=2038116 RepID=A0A2K8T3C2_9NOSO|nr:hypothetical protein [Nostoc flagelliforme]AUB42120.1 putative NTPase, NACHT family domain [Nostoc flagelliforme CCNUN1]
MPDSEDPKQVNNDLRNAQFGGGFINAEIVNAGRIGGDIYNIHFGQQTVTSGNSIQSQNQRQRSQSERDSLEKAYTLQSQKVANLRTALVIETDVSRKFQYEQQLQSEECTLKELGDKLNAIEQQLQANDESGVETDTSLYNIEEPPIEQNSNNQDRTTNEALPNSRRDFYLKQLAQKNNELAAIESQLQGTLSAVDELKLNNQAEVILKKIEELEVKLKQS